MVVHVALTLRVVQVLDGEQTLSILFSLAREVERQEGLVALYSRTVDMDAWMPKILLSCFHRPSVEILQHRLGPSNVFDSVNVGGSYAFDMAKRADRRALRMLCEKKREYAHSSFPKSTFTPHATPFAKEEVTDVEAWTSNEEGEVRLDGTLSVAFVVDKQAAANAIALARSKSRQMLAMPSRRRMSSSANLIPFIKLNRSGTRANIAKTTEDEEGESFDFAAAMSRTRTEHKIVSVRYFDTMSGIVRATGQDDKPFNARWDGGRTTLLLQLDDKSQRTLVQVLTPRGETEVAREVVEWSSPKKTTITISEPGAEVGHEPQRPQHMRHHSTEAADLHPSTDKVVEQETVSSPSFAERSIDFDMAQRRAKGQRFWKPWAGFERSMAEDFAVQTIRLRDRKGGIGMMMERVKAQLGEASCVNYQIDLTLPVKMHTIPRHFSVIISPGSDIEVYANTEGLPCEENHMWRAELDGPDRFIVVRPTDKNYIASKYFITVVTSQRPAQFEVTVQVAPYPASLRQANPILENNVASNTTFAAMTKRKGLTPPEAIQHLTVANSKTGRMLSSLMYYTAERRRKSAHGASVPPKATLRLRPSSAVFDRDEFSLTGKRPSTSPAERSRDLPPLDDGEDDDDDDESQGERESTRGSALSSMMLRGGASMRSSVSSSPVPSPQNRRRPQLAPMSSPKPKASAAAPRGEVRGGRLPSASSSSGGSSRTSNR